LSEKSNADDALRMAHEVMYMMIEKEKPQLSKDEKVF
jgi:hypothetical protein